MSNSTGQIDDVDRLLIAALKRDGRASISTLAATVGVTRSTVRKRLQRLEARGDILGYSVILRSDLATPSIRGISLIEIEGRGMKNIISKLSRLPGVDAIHSTSGRWDLIVEISADSPAELDMTLSELRAIEGISRSETSLLLSTHRTSRVVAG